MNHELNKKFELKNGSLYWRSNRKAALVGQRAGADHVKGYRQIYYDGKYFLEHQLIWAMKYGYFPKQLDHINSNKQDNRIENLREATNSQNQKNTKTRITSKSGVKNVKWILHMKKWQVRLRVNKTPKIVGYFDDLELAELVAIEARNKFHGKYSNHKIKELA